MASALFNARADPARARATSAGPHPGRRIYAPVVEAMREIGIDLTSARPQYLSHALVEGAHALIVMGCADEGPFVPKVERIEWNIEAVENQPIEIVRRTRDDVARRVDALLRHQGWLR